MSKVLLQCLSHTPLVGHFDPAQNVLDEVNATVATARKRIEAFDPELVLLFSPDHFNGFFYNVMPSFCIGSAAHAIGDFGTAKGDLSVPFDLANACATAVIEAGVDIAVSYDMQVDHGFAQPLEFFFGGLASKPVIPIFLNAVAPPLPTFKRSRILGDAVGRWAKTLDKRILILGSGGLSHQPPVPQYPVSDEPVRAALRGGGYNLSPEDRAARTQRTIDAGRAFTKDQSVLFPLNPEWDNGFLDLLSAQRFDELDRLSSDTVSQLTGRSTNEVKAWVAAFAALASYGPYKTSDRYYREIPEWIAGFGGLAAEPLGA